MSTSVTRARLCNLLEVLHLGRNPSSGILSRLREASGRKGRRPLASRGYNIQACGLSFLWAFQREAQLYRRSHARSSCVATNECMHNASMVKAFEGERQLLEICTWYQVAVHLLSIPVPVALCGCSSRKISLPSWTFSTGSTETRQLFFAVERRFLVSVIFC